jgi:hypothetical protein
MNIPVTLMEVLEVSREVLRNGRTYTQATGAVTHSRNLRSPHTVPNACTRIIGLNTAQFRRLLSDPSGLAEHLARRFPPHKATIYEYLLP